MSIFKKKKSLVITDHDPIYKVKYLGNVQTAMMKGEGCVDKPVGVIWNNYLRSTNPGLDMRLTLTTCGLKAETREQGLTEYRAHRISYCIAHPAYPKLFVWVYRHEGKKMKLELRCHAVLCKSEAKAKAMAVQLSDKISFALREFMREKTRKQTSRLTLQRTRSLPLKNSVVPLRTKMLSTGQNFKPPISKSNTAPRLGAIHEDHEQEEEEGEWERDYGVLTEEEEPEVEDDEFDGPECLPSPTIDALTLCGHDTCELGAECRSQRIIDIEIGNDIDELKLDEDVKYIITRSGDSDDESSESSGFNEPDSKDGSLTAQDDNSLDGEDAVCETPSPPSPHIPDETEVTSF
ncbi:protein FAM43A-like [Mya arenaria]|uniref:protein FAM43A-like n=1 Tax=Mya arenaria TaxID=6604 RepID=UPI0022E32137|nr:protein FAM43A-like [Mya arenaria]